MKFFCLVCASTLLLFTGTTSFASEIMPGTYQMQTDVMQMNISFTKLPNGKFAVNGEGKSSAGSSCRIGDLGAFQGNNLVLGMCSVPFAITDDGFDILASPACIQCQPGASIQGHYKKQ